MRGQEITAIEIDGFDDTVISPHEGSGVPLMTYYHGGQLA